MLTHPSPARRARQATQARVSVPASRPVLLPKGKICESPLPPRNRRMPAPLTWRRNWRSVRTFEASTQTGTTLATLQEQCKRWPESRGVWPPKDRSRAFAGVAILRLPREERGMMPKKLTKEELRELSPKGQPHPVFLRRQQYRVAKLYAQGLTYREIGKKLGISPKTVATYLHLVYCGLPLHSRRGLQLSFKAGLIQRRKPREPGRQVYSPWF